MKQCEWCENKMKASNYKKHLGRCFFKSKINLKKSEIDELKKGKVIVQDPNKENIKNEIAFLELKHYLTECYNKSVSLYKKLVEDDGRDPIEKINEMQVSPVTKENYIREWKLFNDWLLKNKKSAGKDTANTYLANLKCRASTIKKKHNELQRILQHLIDNSIKLNRIGMRISYIPKYALTNEEITNYLKEQKKSNTEDYLIQRLMLTYGLRVNTIALLRVKHLEFLERVQDEEATIYLPDSKTKRHRVEPINEDLAELLEEWVEGKNSEDDFVFYKDGTDKSERRRSQDICIRINKIIKESKVIKKKGNYKYTSHMFRKTRAYNMFQSRVRELKEEVRASIGQSSGSMAVEHYIN